MDDKHTLSKKYDESKKEICDLLKKVNAFDCVKILLSFKEALDGELVKESFQLETRKLHQNPLHLGMIDSTVSTIEIIKEILGIILIFSDLKKTELNRTPVIITSFVTDESDPEIQNWITKKFDKEKDGMFTATIQLLEGSYKAKRFILIKDFHYITGNEQIPLVIDLMRKYGALRSIQTIFRNQIDAHITSEGKFSFQNPDPYATLSRNEMTLRKINNNESFPFWKANVDDISKEGLLSTRLSSTAPKQKSMQDLEHNEFFNEFISIPEICKSFEELFKIPLTKFRDITLAIKRLSLSNTTYVVSLPKPTLIAKLKKLSHCSKSDIEIVLDILILKIGDPIFAKSIFYNGFECIYSWSMITFPLHNLMSNLYDRWIDGNNKGIEFEKDCRNFLQLQSCFVLNDRLLLPALNTDIDVVGSKGKFLFVIECKAEARKDVRKNSQIHQFENYYKKTLQRGQWISKNFSQFLTLLNEKNFHLDQNIEFVIPLLISRIQYPPTSNLITLSLNELKQIVSNIDYMEKNSWKIELDSTVVQIPIFQINNSDGVIDDI